MFRNTLPVGWANVTVGALCPSDTDRHGFKKWDLRALQTQGDTQKNYPLTIAINTALRRLGVTKAFAPNTSESDGQVIEPDVLRTRIRLGSTDLYRQENLPADGVFLQPGEAFVMCEADCPLIIAAADSFVIAAYARTMRIVDAIIVALAQRITRDDTIALCIQLATPAHESALQDRAVALGIRSVYAMGSLCNYPALAQTQDGKDTDRRNLIIVKRES